MSNSMIIDAHTHIGYWPNLRKTKKCLIQSMKEHHVSKGLFSFDASEFENDDKNSVFEEHNPVVDMNQLTIAKKALYFAKSHKSKFKMLIWIKPFYEKNVAELEDFYLKNKKYIAGLKIHPCMSHLRIIDSRVKPYLEFAEKYHLPVCVHTADDKYSSVKHLATVARKYPNVNFIAAHLQLLSDNEDALEVLSKVPNVYGDTAWVPPETILKCKKLGILNKIMFGSDCPIDGYQTYTNDFYQALFNNTINLETDEWENLMYKNAIKIYKLN